MSDFPQPQKKWNRPAIIGLVLTIVSLSSFVLCWLLEHLYLTETGHTAFAAIVIWVIAMTFALRGCIECRRRKGRLKGAWVGALSFGLAGAFVASVVYWGVLSFYASLGYFYAGHPYALMWAFAALAGGALLALLVLVRYWLAKDAPPARHG